MKPKLVYGRGLTSSWYTADAYSDRLARMGQAFLYYLLSLLLMFGYHALHQRYSL